MMATRCPRCNSTQVSVEVSGLTARLVCKACSHKGPRYKAMSKDDIPLICELVERSAMTFIEEDGESPEQMAFGRFAAKFGNDFASLLNDMCSKTSCNNCVLSSEHRGDWTDTLPIRCNNRTGRDISTILVNGHEIELSSVLASEQESS